LGCPADPCGKGLAVFTRQINIILVTSRLLAEVRYKFILLRTLWWFGPALAPITPRRITPRLAAHIVLNRRRTRVDFINFVMLLKFLHLFRELFLLEAFHLLEPVLISACVQPMASMS